MRIGLRIRPRGTDAGKILPACRGVKRQALQSRDRWSRWVCGASTFFRDVRHALRRIRCDKVRRLIRVEIDYSVL